MAKAGGGRYQLVEHVSQLPRMMREELHEGLEVVARDVAVLVRPRSRGYLQPLHGVSAAWHAEDMFTAKHLRIDLGDLASAQAVVFGISIDCPAGEDGEALMFDVEVIFGKGPESLPIQTAKLTFAPAELQKRQPRNRVVDRMVAKIYASQARIEATGLNRARDFKQAEERLQKVRARIATYAGDDADLLKVLDDMAPVIQAMAAPMMEMDRKKGYTEATHVQGSRKVDGKRLRKDDVN